MESDHENAQSLLPPQSLMIQEPSYKRSCYWVWRFGSRESYLEKANLCLPLESTKGETTISRYKTFSSTSNLSGCY